MIDEATGLKELEERKEAFIELSEIERTIYSLRTILGDVCFFSFKIVFINCVTHLSQSEKSKLMKQLNTLKLELENGTLAEPKKKALEFSETLSHSLHNAVREEQKVFF